MHDSIKTLLEQYSAAKLEMQLIDYEAHQYHTVIDHVKGSMDDYPYTEHSIPITGIDLTICDLLEARRKSLTEKRRAVEEYITQLDDSYIACIIRLRYIRGLEWEQVVDEMNVNGAKYTNTGLRKAISRYLKSCPTCHT